MYSIQIKKSVSYVILGALILQIGSSTMAMQNTPTGGPSQALKLVPLLSLVGGFCGWKFFQNKRDKFLQETRDQLPEEMQKLIVEYASPEESNRKLKHTIKLLPAILRVQKVTFDSALDNIQKIHANKNALLNTAEEFQAVRTHIEELNKHRNPDCAIALHATVIAPGYGHAADVHQFDLLERQQHNPNNLLIKNEVELHTLLGNPILPGQIALVSYSDGDLRIELCDDDKLTLKDLSDKQTAFLNSLHSTKRVLNNGVPTILFTSTENAKFYRLFDRGQRNCIREFYNIKFKDRQFMNTILAISIGFCAAVAICTFRNSLNFPEKWDLWMTNWNLRDQIGLLKQQLSNNNIPLPAGVPPASTTKIGSFTVTF